MRCDSVMNEFKFNYYSLPDEFNNSSDWVLSAEVVVNDFFIDYGWPK